MTSTYVSGHHPSVLRSHQWRTASNSAAHLLPILYEHPDFTLLDVGCGPGTITLDLAQILSSGHVYGIDPSTSVIEQAQKTAAERKINNVTFLVGDLYDLASAFSGETPEFDIVHNHQVLQHVSEPVKAIKSMTAVLKRPGGILSCKVTDNASWVWHPESAELLRFRQVWEDVAAATGCDANAGRRIVSWAMEAGFTRDQIKATASAWCYSTPAEREWWGNLWSERIRVSEFATKAIEGGHATREELDTYSKAWERWAAAEDGWYGMMHAEILCYLTAPAKSNDES